MNVFTVSRRGCLVSLLVSLAILLRILFQNISNEPTERHQQSGHIRHQILKKSNSFNVVLKHSLHLKSKSVRVVKFNGSEFDNLENFCFTDSNFSLQTLITPVGKTPIYVHTIVDDKWISANIKNYGKWEYRNVQTVFRLLQTDPELGFLDIGAHLGVFSLSVAKLGRTVVSVDPLRENVKRLCKSAEKSGLSNLVTIVFNPLSDKHRIFSLKTEPGNLSGTKVIESDTSGVNTNMTSNVSFTATLDDLIPKLPFRKAVLKIDVQNHEYLVIKGGQLFFNVIDVIGIIMEWELIKNDVNAKSLVDILFGYNFTAVSPYNLKMTLDINNFKTWPVDVVWLKHYT